jgi:hypothetical protein
MSDNDQHNDQKRQMPQTLPRDTMPIEDNERQKQEMIDRDALLERMRQIVETHRHDPNRELDEDRFRRLAEQLLQGKEEIERQLIEEGLAEEELEAEINRRAEELVRFAAGWTPSDPLEARPKNRNDTTTAQNLPIPRQQAPLANDLGWTPLLALPGYADLGPMGVAIRTLGDAIFRTFPCFAAMTREAEKNGLDPLGQVQVLSSLSERQQGVVQERIKDLDRFAFPVRSERIRELNRLPGYRPEIKICFSEEHSFLVVRERRATGAPVDACYIYSWIGGIAFYRSHPEQIATLRNMIDLGDRTLLPTPTEKTVFRIGT